MPGIAQNLRASRPKAWQVLCEVDSPRIELHSANGIESSRCWVCIIGHVSDQRCVYVLLSTVYQNRYYTGLTSDVQVRLAAHSAGLSKHTANGRPWKLVTTIECSDAERARNFELYLKSGSGRAFARRYFR